MAYRAVELDNLDSASVAELLAFLVAGAVEEVRHSVERVVEGPENFVVDNLDSASVVALLAFPSAVELEDIP